MAETRDFTLLDTRAEPAIYRVPNFLRLLQAYRSYVDEKVSAQTCALSLKEITCPGLRGQNLSSRSAPLTALQEELSQAPTHRLRQSVEDMLSDLARGDRTALAIHFQDATSCFQELSQLSYS